MKSGALQSVYFPRKQAKEYDLTILYEDGKVSMFIDDECYYKDAQTTLSFNGKRIAAFTDGMSGKARFAALDIHYGSTSELAHLQQLKDTMPEHKEPIPQGSEDEDEEDDDEDDEDYEIVKVYEDGETIEETEEYDVIDEEDENEDVGIKRAKKKLSSFDLDKGFSPITLGAMIAGGVALLAGAVTGTILFIKKRKKNLK